MFPETQDGVCPVLTLGRRAMIVGGALFCALGVYGLMPASMPESARRTTAIFVAAAVLWVSEAIPLYATSLCVVVAEILLLAQKGGLAGSGGRSGCALGVGNWQLDSV